MGEGVDSSCRLCGLWRGGGGRGPSDVVVCGTGSTPWCWESWEKADDRGVWYAPPADGEVVLVSIGWSVSV